MSDSARLVCALVLFVAPWCVVGALRWGLGVTMPPTHLRYPPWRIRWATKPGRDSQQKFRIAFSTNPSCPPDLLAQWAQDPHTCFAARWNVASNPRCPGEALGWMVGLQNDDLTAAALKNPHFPDHLRAIVALGQSSRPSTTFSTAGYRTVPCLGA